ncbi:carbon-nitrogen hydrolase family protein [Pseudomonas eucalypticola]|uniref:Carbon-nitrogen hydrolase family protein n=1 Tax=Pseudomonas eucalypticola TaxID=2599595 RepID=A0A7D5DC06_9PSED|nr:carbon-nitrogen hydrolase family protein [Pseudomonas eucalypticola]QKZ07095.1 carbon-nitrogen hydrolase family protein [Pseudomonas eucalypticola]
MKIALCQCEPQPLAVVDNLARLQAQVRQAKAQGAALVVFPEMFLTGYDIGPDAVQRLAETANGPSAHVIAGIAEAHDMAIAYGYPERGADGQVYNSAQLFDARGISLLNYRKTHLFGELDHRLFSPGGDDFPVVELNGWKVGVLICYDIEFPEAARRLALGGAELILVPTANMLPFEFVAQVTVRSRAFENQCYLGYANYCGAEGSLRYCGLSSIVGADGNVLAIAGAEPSLLFAQLSRKGLGTVRAAYDYLRDRRAELYRPICEK